MAERTLKEVDVVLWLVEPTTFIGAGEQHIADQLKKVTTPVILVINKIDTVKKEEVILAFIAAYQKMYVISQKSCRYRPEMEKNTEELLEGSDLQVSAVRTSVL